MKAGKARGGSRIPEGMRHPYGRDAPRGSDSENIKAPRASSLKTPKRYQVGFNYNPQHGTRKPKARNTRPTIPQTPAQNQQGLKP